MELIREVLLKNSLIVTISDYLTFRHSLQMVSGHFCQKIIETGPGMLYLVKGFDILYNELVHENMTKI